MHLVFVSETSGEMTPALFLLGPNIASSKKDANLTVNLVVTVAILYMLKLDQPDKAWHLLEENGCAKSNKLEVILEYLKGNYASHIQGNSRHCEFPLLLPYRFTVTALKSSFLSIEPLQITYSRVPSVICCLSH